jgi:GST-like protein
MFQMGGIGPMFGQCNHFRQYAPEKIPYAIDRYTNEVGRLLGVMDRRLGDRGYLADDYSIADMACFPWVRLYENMGQRIEDFPSVKRWLDAIAARPAVGKALQVLAERRRQGPMDATTREMLFGSTQYQRR